MWDDPLWRRMVVRWSVVSLVLIAAVCHFSYDFYQFDEYYQITEFVSYKLGKTPADALAWEYHDQMRPWLQPAVYYAAARGLNWLGIENPFTLAEVFRAMSGACAWAAIVSLMLSAYVFFPDDRRRRPTVIVLATLFILPYLAARTSSEAMSANLFSLGFAAIVLGSAWRCGLRQDLVSSTKLGAGPLPLEITPHPRPLSRKGRGEDAGLARKGRGEKLRPPRPSSARPSSLQALVPRPFVPWAAALMAGVLFGLSFECRYQIAFAVVGVMGWIFFFSAGGRRSALRTLALLSCGGLLMVGLGTAVDCWGYGRFVVAPWNYFRMNILLHAADRFGVTPAWWYLVGVNSGPMIVLTLIWTVAMLAMWIRYPRHLLTWATAAFCIAHCAVGHKEVRFLFPIAQVGAMAIVLGIAPRVGRLRWNGAWRPSMLAWLWTRRHSRWAMALYASNFAALAVMGFSTRQQSVLLQKMIYEHYPRNCYAYILGRDTKSLYQNVGVDMFFYRPADFHLARLDGYDELNKLLHDGPRKFLVITDCVRKAPEQDLVVPHARLVYRSYPEWVENYNYFNWLERSRRYSVYEVDRDEKDSAAANTNVERHPDPCLTERVAARLSSPKSSDAANPGP